MKQEDFPWARITSRDPADVVRKLRELPGGGIPLLPPTLHRSGLKLTAHKVYTSGILFLEYDLI